MTDKVVRGAFPFRAGIDQGSSTFRPKSPIPECEAYEQLYPILYLCRHAALNGGHGEFRGGNGIVFGWVGHGSSDQLASTSCMAPSFSSQSGMCGGHCGWDRHLLRGQRQQHPLADRRACLAEPSRRAPRGDWRPPPRPSRQIGRLNLGEGVVIELAVYGGGGFGDPLQLDPERVADDVKKGAVSSAIARSVYGIALGDDIRSILRRPPGCAVRVLPVGWSAPRPRRSGLTATAARASSTSPPLVSTTAVVGSSTAQPAATISAATRRPRSASTPRLHEIDPDIFIDSAEEIDGANVYRRYLCRGRGVGFENELTIEGEPPIFDIQRAESEAAA